MGRRPTNAFTAASDDGDLTFESEVHKRAAQMVFAAPKGRQLQAQANQLVFHLQAARAPVSRCVLW